MQSEQINVEYFFRLLYEWIYGPHGAVNYAALQSLFAHVWIWITFLGYALSIFGLFVIVYCTMQIFELRKREEHFYHTLITPPEAKGTGGARWQHIASLAGGATPSEWREAIIEADIMLDDVLAERGYVGDTVADKLKTAHFGSVQDAWEAHKVRNQIAHQGSAFDLAEPLARRTLARFESVFRELNAI